MPKKYTLNRAKFIKYYSPHIQMLLDKEQVAKDLIASGEFILDTEQILQSVGYISPHFWGLHTPVHFSKIQLVV